MLLHGLRKAVVELLGPGRRLRLCRLLGLLLELGDLLLLLGDLAAQFDQGIFLLPLGFRQFVDAVVVADRRGKSTPAGFDGGGFTIFRGYFGFMSLKGRGGTARRLMHSWRFGNCTFEPGGPLENRLMPTAMTAPTTVIRTRSLNRGRVRQAWARLPRTPDGGWPPGSKIRLLEIFKVICHDRLPAADARVP